VKLPFALARRRSVWLPTLWGWVLLVIVAAALVVVGARGLYPFLAMNEPVGARILVIEGWMTQEALDQALAAFRSGGYGQAVTTGAPIDSGPQGNGYRTLAERAADYLKGKGLPESAVVAVPSPASAQDRTFLSAVMVREWTKRNRVDAKSIDIFSEGAHARRSRLLYQEAFGPDVTVGVLAAPSRTAGDDWWRTAQGAREVLDQAIALAWTKLFFRPPPPGSHQERWAQPAPVQKPE
jgi:hypothetical protein